MAFDGAVAGGDFECGPEFVAGAGGCGDARFPNDDVPGEWIVPPQPGAGFFQAVFRELPGDERAFGQAGGEQCLAYPTDGAGLQHGFEPSDDFLLRESAGAGDALEGARVEACDAVFGDGKKFPVDGIGAGGGVGWRARAGHGGHGQIS